MSVNVRVDPSRLALDGDDLYRIATKLDSAARTAQSALSGTGGMAGNEESAQEFIDAYGEGAENTLNAAGSYAHALRSLDTLLGDTANAYKDAGTVGTLNPVPTRSASTTPGSAATFSVPNAKAPGAIGPLGEFQEFVMDALAQIGVVLPDADSGNLGNAASAWSEFSTSISSAASELDGTLTNLAAMDIPQADDIRTSRKHIVDKLGEIAKGADGLSELCAKQKENVDAMWEEIGWFLAQMAAEIALEAGLGIALTAITGGLAAPAVVAKIALTVMRWVVKIGNLVKKLVTLTRAQAIAAKLLLKALKEGTQSAIATVTVQFAVNEIRGPGHQQDLLAAGLGAFAGGAIGGRVGDGGANILRVGSRSGATRVGMNAAVGTVEGAADGFTDGLVQSAVTGTEFNPLSSSLAGALVGGGIRPVTGGTRPSTPSAGSGGSGSSSPDAVDVPSASTPDSPSTPAGMDTPSAPNMDTPAAPQGSGGAPSSSSTAGGGASTDTPDAPVVDGAGDASTSVDSSTSVDIPAGDAPDGTGVDVSSSADGPSVPDVSSPSGDGGASSTPDSSPSTPDASSPSTPDSSSPSTPDVNTPSTPDSNAPSTADVNTPSTPDSSSPSTPDVNTPSTPDSNAPSTPDVNTPSTPDSNAPSTPDVSTPSTPDSSAPDATPSTPDSTPGNGSASSAPVAGAAAAGGASAAPSSPSTNTPDANTSVDTSAFESAVAADAATPDAQTPDATTPEPDATAPDQTVDPDALDAGDAAVAGAAAAGAAGVVGLHAGASGGKAPSTPASPAGAASPSSPSAPSTPSAPSSPSSNTSPSSTPDANTPSSPDASTPDANTPDSTTPDAPEGSNSTDRTTADIDTALAEINPNFDPLDPSNGYATNCGNTSAILNDFLNGNPTSEAPTGTLGIAEMEARTGNPQTPMTPDQIADSLREMGAGSHCVVGIDRGSDEGHWFNAYFDGDTVWSIDAQNGTRSAWPPNEPDATNWDASIRPEDVADPKTPEAETPATGTSPNASSPDATAPSSPSAPSAPTAPAAPSTPATPATPATPDSSGTGSPDATPSTPDSPSSNTSTPDPTSPASTTPEASTPESPSTPESHGTPDADPGTVPDGDAVSGDAADSGQPGDGSRTGAGDSAHTSSERTDTPNSPLTDGMTSQQLAEHFRPRTPTQSLRDLVQGDYIRGEERPDPIHPEYRPTVFEADHIIPLREIVDLPGFRDLTYQQMLDIVNLPDNFWGLGKRTNASKGAQRLSEWAGHSAFGPIPDDVRQMLYDIDDEALEAVTDAISALLHG